MERKKKKKNYSKKYPPKSARSLKFLVNVKRRKKKKKFALCTVRCYSQNKELLEKENSLGNDKLKVFVHLGSVTKYQELGSL